MRYVIALLVGLTVLGGPLSAAYAEPASKVFVCKYVGTPGADERLQTGNNPIDVSVNSIKDYNGVGSYFNDAQGRSYVLAEDNGQAEPDVSECPGPDRQHKVRYKVTVRMTGQGVVRDSIRALPRASVSGTVYGLVCAKKVSAGFSVHIAAVNRLYGTYSSKHGPVLRVKTRADGLLLKLRASEGC